MHLHGLVSLALCYILFLGTLMPGVFRSASLPLNDVMFRTLYNDEGLLGILASTIVMWFSRQREFRADAGGANLAGRQSMINALARLDNMHSGKNQLPEQMEAMGISGKDSVGFKRLFMSHPPISERIAALQRVG